MISRVVPSSPSGPGDGKGPSVSPRPSCRYPCWQPDLSSSPSLLRRGSRAYFIFMLSSWFPAVFLFPLYGKEHFPIWGRRGGGFPARPGFASQPLERFDGLMPASTRPHQSLAGLRGVVKRRGGGGLGRGFGHRTPWHGALGFPCHPEKPLVQGTV